MESDDKKQSDLERQTSDSKNRRKFLRTAGVATAGAAAGFAGGRLTKGPDAPQILAAAKDAPRFAGKVVLITGGTSGIGRAAAEAFAAEGAKVGFCGRREDRGAQVEQAIRSQGGEAIYSKVDVRVEEQLRQFTTGIVERYGVPDVAFINAGIHLQKPVHEVTTAQWKDVLDTNLQGAFFAMKYVIPHMLEAGHGNILVTSSANALQVRPGFSAYGASKHALMGLVKSAALDYGPQGIRVNAILPGATNTEMVRRLAGMIDAPDPVWEAAAEQWAKSNLPTLQRMATPEEIAAFAVDLASDRYPVMTGSAQLIDGGQTADL